MLRFIVQYMLSQHRAIGLDTNCTVIMRAPLVRLPDCHVHATLPASKSTAVSSND